MPTCGYTCPQCEGLSHTADGEVCDWCTVTEEKPKEATNEIGDTTAHE